MLNGVIAQKLQSLDQVLAELRSLGQVDAAQLRDDRRTRRAVERDLIDLDILITIVNRRLADFDRFRDEVLAYVRDR